MKTLHGTSASPGIVFGRAVLYIPRDLVVPEGDGQGPDREVERLERAFREAIAELRVLTEHLKADAGTELAHIFRSQQTILEDDSLRAEMVEEIRKRSCSAEKAVDTVFAGYIAMFDELGEQDYNRSRGADMKDVERRLMRKLLGVEEVDLSRLPPSTIIVAPELLPSDTALMDRAHVGGMITETGGITSHTAILAKSLGIPAAVSVADALHSIGSREELILDASNPDGAVIYVQPDASTGSALSNRLRLATERSVRLAAEKDAEPVTPDGHRVTLSANIGSPEDLDGTEQLGVKSVGLFRTEFLFMKSATLPTEEEQYAAYCKARDKLAGGMLIIRTLDAGGDKSFPSIQLPKEANPFLGYRALRISLDREDMFRTQLRAALRASASGDVRIMFPMVCGMEDWTRARAALDAAREELAAQGEAFNARLEVGIMVEIPSAVLMAEELAQEVDFMSIGTNDLTQYLLAADRLNENVASYYKPYHPAVLRAISQVVEAAHRHGKWVGICGELAGMTPAIPVLIGLGVDELSMSPRSLPEARHVVLSTAYAEAKDLAAKALLEKDAGTLEAGMRRYIAKE